jgi:large subunit ribosomal protein L19
MGTTLLQKIDQEMRKDKKIPTFRIGDSVRVHVKIKEGDKERVQVFAGTVIARDGGGALETFTVRRISYGEGVERKFPVYCNSIEKIEVERSGAARRAKLYYLRGRTGRHARIKEQTRADDAGTAAPAATAAPA